MTDYHAHQFDGTACGRRNCAACTSAMAIAFAGGPQLTGAQIRAESGVSCTLGEDTVSGGLRIADVERVCAAHGVTVNFGGMQNWPATALEARLALGQGAIVLGDAADAPISPTTGVVYHSAWCHGLTATKQTHWHDPRLTTTAWVPVSKVITYWQGMDHGYRYAGFVAPDQIPAMPPTDTESSTEEPDMALPILNPRPARGTVVTRLAPDGSLIRARSTVTGEDVPFLAGDTYQVICVGDLGDSTMYIAIAGTGVVGFPAASVDWHPEESASAPPVVTTGTLATTTALDGQSVTVRIV